jgi:hypothetical protein
MIGIGIPRSHNNNPRPMTPPTYFLLVWLDNEIPARWFLGRDRRKEGGADLRPCRKSLGSRLPRCSNGRVGCNGEARRYIALAIFHWERWPSGLRRTLGKRVYGKPYRGFESHPLRQGNPTTCSPGAIDPVLGPPFLACWTPNLRTSNSHRSPSRLLSGDFSLRLCTLPLEYGFADADEVDVLRSSNLPDFEARSLER